MKRLVCVALAAFVVVGLVAGLVWAAPTYGLCEKHLDTMRDIINRDDARYTAAGTETLSIYNRLDGLPATYAETIAEINAQSTANPDDVKWKLAKARLGAFTVEFQALKPKAEAAKLAFDLIESKGAAAVKAKLEEIP